MKGWALAVLLSGCVVGDALPVGSGGETGDGAGSGSGDQIPTNGLVLDVGLATQLTPAALGLARADGNFDVNPAAAPGFVDVEAGRALLKYIAICALPRDQALVVAGKPLHGFYGLAPQWATGTCDASCQHWVMGCVLAHANQQGTPVHISLRGDSPNLATTPALEATYPAQEAGFFGSFGLDTDGRPQLYACMGATATDDAADRVIEGRVCGLGSCGLHLAGPCGVLAPGGIGYSACAHDGGISGGYADCRVSQFPDAPMIHEVVTVYTAP